MTSIKNILATFVLVATLSVSVFADGIIIGNRDGNPPCSTKEGIIIGNVVSTVTGIIIGNFAGGIIIGNRDGLLISDRSGLLISDRDGNQTCGIIIGN